MGKYIPEHFTECAVALRAMGFRARTFVRKSNPLDFDSAVRPVRDLTKFERMANSVPTRMGVSRAWFWCEHSFDDWDTVAAICAAHDVVLSGTGYPHEGPDSQKPKATRKRRAA